MNSRENIDEGARVNREIMTRIYNDRVNALLAHNAEVAFNEAMRDPDGMVPVSVVKIYLEQLRRDYYEEIVSLESRL